ncbi:hypothetical protein ACT8ZV_17220 [Nocardioides sp. MAHUQ-72]|uniref:hypothetical protein n=1 Tax=unclassified Nocardioides TaxID=2615069 RepID=UPI003615A3DF
MVFHETSKCDAAENLRLGEFLLARIREEEAVLRAHLEGADGLHPVLRRVLEGAMTACLSRRQLVLEHLDGHREGDSCELLLLLAAGYDHDVEWVEPVPA